MGKAKTKERKTKLELPPFWVNALFLSALWSFFLSYRLGKIHLAPFILFGLLFVELLLSDFLNKYLQWNRKEVATLNVVFGIQIAVAFALSLKDPLHLKAYSDGYYLITIGAGAGVIAKNFLRKRGVIEVLSISALTVGLASANLYTALGFFLGNMAAADVYATDRETKGELKAVFFGNSFFLLILTGYWIQIDPKNLWKIVLIYPLSVLYIGFHVLALQKLIDLLPYMYSDEKLERLANLSHPLIESLMLRAPGTYHHSLMVSLLAESVAKKLGADPILTRVGGMLHDIGKIVNPQYFIENAPDRNYHRDLKPETSAAMIKNHVTEGIRLAKKHNLPEEVIKFIPEHQGTKLIKYFYQRALKENPNVDINKFRYEGPIPQSKETAIVMIADTVEAMVRSLKNHSPEALRKAVAMAIDELLKEGQLKDSNLTEEELKKIEDLMVEQLLNYYHDRVKYPKETDKGRKI